MNPGLGQKEAQELNEAYNCLINPSERATYWRYYQQRQADIAKHRHDDTAHRQWEAARQRAEAAERAYHDAEEELRAKYQQAEEARRADEARRKADKKRRLRVMLVGLLSFSLLAAILLVFKLTEGARYYNLAEREFALGDYESAATYFRDAGDYKDAPERNEETRRLDQIASFQRSADKYIENLRQEGYDVADGYSIALGENGWKLVVTDGYITFAGYKWRILEMDTVNRRALLLSDDILMADQFHNGITTPDTDWSGSTLRVYLNTDFYQSFPEKDRLRVEQLLVENSSIVDSNLL
jgi:hypothetical protein